MKAHAAGHILMMTPPIVAIQTDNLPIVMILLEYWTPEPSADVFRTLMLACWRESKAIVELLLEKGVDINMLNAEWLTVMAHAKKVGWNSVVAMIALYGGH